MTNKKINIDIETYCDLDLLEVGVYRYANHPSFEVLMAAYSVDGGPVELVDFMLKTGDAAALYFLINDNDIKHAYNANFERTCLAVHYKTIMPPESWRCSMVHAAELGLPPGLGKVGKVVGLPQDKQKDKVGKELIKFFCKPCKPTQKNGQRTRNFPGNGMERWEEFKEYCRQDVVAEMALKEKLDEFPLIQSEQYLWELDQRITDAGVKLDRAFVNNAAALDAKYKTRLKGELQEITQLVNPNSLPQLKKWITDQTGHDVPSLDKNKMPAFLKDPEDPKIKRVMEIRKQLGKTSTSKYIKMQEVINEDDRAYGLIQFYGANRTGRWAGRLVQVQNLPRNEIKTLDFARSLIAEGKFYEFEMLYDIPNTLSQLIRTAFIPSQGCLFYVADFSAIEARVIAWMAGETWRMDVFNSHGKIYEASASQMFHVPLDSIVKGGENYHMRAKGKVAELALGYGGSVGALKAFGALDMGLEERELKPLVDKWRKTSPAITDFWWSVEAAAKEAIQFHRVTHSHGLEFSFESGILFIKLLNGRRLSYVNARIEPGKYGKDRIVFDGYDQTKGRWLKIETYGPKLVENIVQAISRDCLAFSMVNLIRGGYKIVMHVHDEVIIEKHAADPEATLGTILKIMSRRPKWALDLPLNADGYFTPYYKKD